MIVDDDPFSVLLSEMKLKKYLIKENIIDFSDIKIALEFLEKQIIKESAMIPDLILLEVMMDDGKGWDFITQFDNIMVKNGKFSVQLIIHTSSQLFSDYRRAAQYNSVKGFLMKPMQIRLLSDIYKKATEGKTLADDNP